MVDEIGSFDSFDSGVDAGGSGEGSAELSAEDLIRVQEEMGNAKKMAGQIFKSQRTNKQFALMLSFLFKYVDDEFLLAYVFEIMQHFDQSIIVIFGHFLPNLQEHMDVNPYKPLYSEIRSELETWEWSLMKLGSYYTKLYREFPSLKVIPESLYIDMIMKQLELKGELEGIEEEAKKKIMQGLKKEIFIEN